MQMRTQSKKHKIIRTVLLVILLFLIVAAGGFISVYEGRFQTISSIQKVTDYDEYNLYRMDVKYDYDLDRLIEYGITDNQSFVDAIVKEALPILPVHIKAPDFGCSAFTLQEADGNVLMGRNYDFKRILPQCWFTVNRKMDTNPWLSQHWIISRQIFRMRV